MNYSPLLNLHCLIIEIHCNILIASRKAFFPPIRAVLLWLASALVVVDVILKRWWYYAPTTVCPNYPPYNINSANWRQLTKYAQEESQLLFVCSAFLSSFSSLSFAYSPWKMESFVKLNYNNIIIMSSSFVPVQHNFLLFCQMIPGH